MTYRLSSKKDFSITIGKRVLNSELTEKGLPVYSANVHEIFGYINKDLLMDFSKPSILWGIDGDWMVNTIKEDVPFYPTDHAGVLRVNTDKINYRFLAYQLEKEGNREGFSRSYRASINQIEKLSITLPDIKEQNSAVSKVEEIEKLISLEEEKMISLSIEKDKIINKYLN